MPKIVDHNQYKQSLAKQAAHLFLQHGYSNLGMRQLAQELGISKSALYHYFPSKDALFSASLMTITQKEMESSAPPLDAPLKERIKALLSLIQIIEQRFAGELGLVLDFTRGMNNVQVRENEQMQLAEKRYLELITLYVGDTKAKQIYHILLGGMLGRLLDGGSTSWDEIYEWLYTALKTQ